MKQDYSWLEIAQMPQCCMCCGSRDINLKTNVCYLVAQMKGYGQMKEQTKNMRRKHDNKKNESI